MTEDIVCNKLLIAGAETQTSRYHGRAFSFCSLTCKERFEMEPEDYFTVPHRPLIVPPLLFAMR